MQKSRKRILGIVLTLAALLSLTTAGGWASAVVNTPIVIGGITVGFGDPSKPAVKPEKLMDFVEDIETTTPTYSAVYTGGTGMVSDFYPDILTMQFTPDTSTTLTDLTGSGVTFLAYNTTGEVTSYTTITPAENLDTDGNPTDIYTVKIGTAGGSIAIDTDSAMPAGILNFSPPNVAKISGYLPIGGYATGQEWGSIYSNYDLITGEKSTDGKYKFTGVNGFSDTGVSCGIFGGYIQFDMGRNTISNDTNNPYGVDFIIDGNNTTGNNPEAGSVVVSPDGEHWYELAGSCYYNDYNGEFAVGVGSEFFPQISYMKVAETDTDFDRAGIYYSTVYTGGIIDPDEWEFSNRNIRWWPDLDEGYDKDHVYDIDREVNTNGGAPYVIVDRTKHSPYEIIAYKNITGLNSKFYNIPANFQFGYFDVTPNGAGDGNAANPYIPYFTGKKGGDGFDISWAVNADGTPADPEDVGDVRYIRLYSSLYAVNGDLSSEVCGLYTANHATTPILTTATPTITVGGHSLADLVTQGAATVTTIGNVTYYDASNYSTEYFDTTAEITATAPARTYVYINSDTSGSVNFDFTYGAVYARIIAQDDTISAPSITLIKLQ
jgi:hypothetical protein